MVVAVRVLAGGSELVRSGAGPVPTGISEAVDAGGFGAGNGVDNLDMNGVGPRDTHERVLDSIGSALLDVVSDVAL